MTRDELFVLVKNYLQEEETSFSANFDIFIKSAEVNIARKCYLPSTFENVTGTVASGTNAIAAPADFLSVNSLWMGETGATESAKTQGSVLLQKEPSFLLEMFNVDISSSATSSLSTTGSPLYYSYRDPTTIYVAPVPSVGMDYRLGYHRNPTSLVDSPAGTWLSQNGTNALLFGTMIEGYIYLKGDADTMSFYVQRFEAAIQELTTITNMYRMRDENIGGTPYGVSGMVRRSRAAG